MITWSVVYQIIHTKKNSKWIALDLGKQQALDNDPNAMQQINFNEDLDVARNTTMFFIFEEMI